MSKFKGNTILSKVVRSHKKYWECVAELQEYLKDKVDFEFSIDHQPSDGHMLLNVESGMKIAPVADCLSIIYSKGHLSEDDHEDICI